jgi:polysaccharide export outer membrane protein
MAIVLGLALIAASSLLAWFQPRGPAREVDIKITDRHEQPASLSSQVQNSANGRLEVPLSLRDRAGERERSGRRAFCEADACQISPHPNTEGEGNGAIVQCQALGPAAPYDIRGVDCTNCRRTWWGGFEASRAALWQAYAQGEYVGHDRLAHVPAYRIRVDDQLDMLYRITREETAAPYRLNVGDEIRVESFSDNELNRELLIQPDGTITLRLLGQVHAAGHTVTQLRDDLEGLYRKYYKVPSITVTPLKVNTQLDDLRNTVNRFGGGQSLTVRVTPEGTITLPAVGSLRAQNLTLPELQQEINERYRLKIEGIEIMPVLDQRAPRFVYVLGEVKQPGRFEMTGPTTALQALAMAGSWNVGANIKQIVVFRRGDDWRLLATMINLEGALRGRRPCPPGEIWLSDSDVIIVPKCAILEADDFINLVFTRGIYGVFPMVANLNFSKLSSL